MKLDKNAFAMGAQDNGVSRRRFLGGTAAGISILALGGLAACSSSDEAPGKGGQPRTGGTLRMAIGDNSTNDKLDPAVASSSTAAYLSSMIYAQLVRIDSDFALHPALAESWDVNNNAQEWVFHLRKGVTFHDGSPLTAKDAAWTIKRILDPSLNSPAAVNVESLDASGITAVDDLTLRLSLKRPDPFLGESLASLQVGVVKENQKTFTNATAIGAGPFKLKSFKPGQSFEVVRNPDYFESGLPYLDGIQNSKVDAAIALQALSSGTIDWTDTLDAKSIARLKNDDRFRSPALENPERAAKTYFLHMKLDEAPFNDPRVVMAMKLAADRDEILKAVLAGLGSTTGDVPTPMSNPAYPASVGKRPQDIAKAKQLLAEAGYPNGIEVDLPTADFQPGMTDFSLAYAETVKAAGIRVNVKQVPVETYFDKVFGQVPLFHDFGVLLSPYAMLKTFFQKGAVYNATGFDADGGLTAYMDKALAEPDDAKRTKILSEALAYTAESSGTHIAFWVPVLQTMRSQVRGDLSRTFYSWEKLWIVS